MKYLKKTCQIYEYAFYRTYIWQKKLWGQNSAPEIASLLTPSLLVSMNILIPLLLVLNIILTFFCNINSTAITTPVFQTAGILIFVSLYFLFVSKGKYLKIEQKYKRENKEQKRKGTRLIWSFILLSLLEFLICCLIAWII